MPLLKDCTHHFPKIRVYFKSIDYPSSLTIQNPVFYVFSEEALPHAYFLQRQQLHNSIPEEASLLFISMVEANKQS